MSREVIATNLAPRAIGPYSQGIKSGGVLYVSGCLGLNPDTMKLVDGGVGNQARQVLTNLKNIIEAGGGKMSNTAKVVILLTDMAFFAEVS
jgi:reactive intermediate/imine deaminase